MDDEQIIALYFERNENAISETEKKYGRYLASISFNILASEEDARECVNDTLYSAWNSIPPNRPSMLSTYLGKIIRHLSIDRWRRDKAAKRGGGQIPLALDELEECALGSGDFTDEIIKQELMDKINSLIKELPETERRVFLRRYWYLDSIDSIAEAFGFSAGKVKSMLLRTRRKLRKMLAGEGY